MVKFKLGYKRPMVRMLNTRPLESFLYLSHFLSYAELTFNKFYKVPRSEITEKLTQILDLRGMVTAEKKLLIEALALYSQSRADFVNCFLVAKSRRRGITVYSFDEEDFKKLGCQWEKP